jgi:hypothetical protein
MKNTTARHFAAMFLQEMADEYGATATEIRQQMPRAQAIVAGLLFMDPAMPVEELAFQFQQQYINAH